MTSLLKAVHGHVGEEVYGRGSIEVSGCSAWGTARAAVVSGQGVTYLSLVACLLHVRRLSVPLGSLKTRRNIWLLFVFVLRNTLNCKSSGHVKPKVVGDGSCTFHAR